MCISSGKQFLNEQHNEKLKHCIGNKIQNSKCAVTPPEIHFITPKKCLKQKQKTPMKC